MSDPAHEAKRAAARAAADLVGAGMCLGLGTGSTFALVLEALAARNEQEALGIRGVPTSEDTARQARRLGIPVTSLDEVDELDLAIDGADEVDPDKRMIKGGGGALTREKIVAAAAREMVVVVHRDKLVERLGRACPLPVEVLPFGWKRTARWIGETLGCDPRRRRAADGGPKITDNGGYVLDCAFDGGIDDPEGVARVLADLPGVVEHGLFLGMAGRVVVADEKGHVTVR